MELEQIAQAAAEAVGVEWFNSTDEKKAEIRNRVRFYILAPEAALDPQIGADDKKIAETVDAYKKGLIKPQVAPPIDSQMPPVNTDEHGDSD